MAKVRHPTERLGVRTSKPILHFKTECWGRIKVASGIKGLKIGLKIYEMRINSFSIENGSGFVTDVGSLIGSLETTTKKGISEKTLVSTLKYIVFN